MDKIWNTKSNSNPGNSIEQWEFSHIANGKAKWYNHFGRPLGRFLEKVKIFTMQSSSHASSYFNRGVQNICSCKTCQ